MHEILLSHYQALLPRSPGRGLCLGTSGSYGTETIRVIPGAGWKGLAVTATFHPADGKAVRVLVPADGILTVPPEAVAAAASADSDAVIVFSGTSDGVQRISADLSYSVLPHASIEGDASVPPTESEWAQLTAAYASKVDRQQSVADAGKVLGIGADGKVTPVYQTGGTGGSGAPSDWNVNDPAASGYIRNRTHWAEDPVKVTVLPEQTVTIGEEGMAVFTPEAGLESGSVYTITVNGVSDTGTAYELDEIISLGNGGLLGMTDTGENYFVGYSTEEGLMLLILPEMGEYTVSIHGIYTKYHVLDENYLPKLIGKSGEGINAEIFNTIENQARGSYSHAEGRRTDAKGYASHAEGTYTVSANDSSHAEGNETLAFDLYSHAEGNQTTAHGECSHSEGLGTFAAAYQHAEGKWNIKDTSNRYAHIIGGGQADTIRANIHTVDWGGNAWYAGYIQPAGGVILLSPNNTRYRLLVDNTGTLYTEVVS